MKIASTIIVLVLAAAGVFAMVRDATNKQAFSAFGKQETIQDRPLLTAAQLPIDAVTRITLRRNDETLIFERTDADWNQVEPFAHPMDAFSIRQIVQQALEVRIIESINLGEVTIVSADIVGMNPPAAEVRFEWDGGSFGIELGKRGVAGRAYLRIAGASTVEVATANLHQRAVEMDHREWRSRTIFAGTASEITTIEWNNGPARVRLIRERNRWMMEQPVRTRVDANVRDQYLDAIGRSIVGGFILDQPSESDLMKFGLFEPIVSLMIESQPTGDGTQLRQQKLLIGGRAGGGTQDFFGMIEGRPTSVRITGPVLAALFRQPNDLIAHTASGVIAADVKSLVIRDKATGNELRLQRELDAWHMVDETGALQKKVDAQHVQELLNNLTQLRALGVQMLNQFPLELEFASITLYGFDGRAIDTVRIIKEQDTGRWAMENGDNVLRIYPASLTMRLGSEDW